jgi:hypothetical protein
MVYNFTLQIDRESEREREIACSLHTNVHYQRQIIIIIFFFNVNMGFFSKLPIALLFSHFCTLLRKYSVRLRKHSG